MRGDDARNFRPGSRCTAPRSVAWVAAALALGGVLGACDPAGPDASPTAPAADRGAEIDADGVATDDDDAPSELPGRFREARGADAALSPEQQRLADELNAIGYASGTQPARASGVTRFDRDAAMPGLNFFTSGHAEGATLMDLQGNVLHEWRFRSADAFPADLRPRAHTDRWWRRAYLFPNGDVLAVITGFGLLKIDAHSKLVWATPMHVHHDVAFAPNGDLWTLTRRVHIVPRIDPKRPIVEDRVAVLDAQGVERRSFSLLEAFENSEFADVWRRSGAASGDLFHTNSIEILDGTAAGAVPAFRAGNLLISLRRLHAIAVVDPDAGRVVWAHTGDYRAQHDPKILPNGNLLLFDNHGLVGPSAVIEFDPATMEVVWEFRGSAEEPFYSKTCGTAERLANGNTLITETDFGRAFEVTPEGRVVWEFYNPHRAGEGDRFIASLPEMIRLPPDLPVDWIDATTRDADPDGV